MTVAGSLNSKRPSPRPPPPPPPQKKNKKDKCTPIRNNNPYGPMGMNESKSPIFGGLGSENFEVKRYHAAARGRLSADKLWGFVAQLTDSL